MWGLSVLGSRSSPRASQPPGAGFSGSGFMFRNLGFIDLRFEIQEFGASCSSGTQTPFDHEQKESPWTLSERGTLN